jgi:23S rRNA pseudouridine955/2504/2580 synthase
MKSQRNSTSGVRLVQVDPDHAGQRLDNFLTARLKGVPRAAVYRMIRTGQVRINGGRCKAATRLEIGDEVRVPPARTAERGEFNVPEGACRQIEAAILFENTDLMVVDKPSGMAVHSGSGLPWGLIDVVRRIRPGRYIELVHRLDRETSGCLLLACNGDALKRLSAQFREGNVRKKYLCLMNGNMPQSVMDVDAPLVKIQAGDQRQVVVRNDGKPAHTRFHLLQPFSCCSYTEAELFTGRTHQIRVHAQHVGLPLAGDEKYSQRATFRQWRKRGLKRLFLHAHQLVLDSREGEPLAFDAPLPPLLRSILDGLEK